MPRYARDHIHLRSRDPEAAVHSTTTVRRGDRRDTQSDGRPRIDVEIDGLTICIAQALPDQIFRTRRSGATSASTTSGCGWKTSTKPPPT